MEKMEWSMTVTTNPDAHYVFQDAFDGTKRNGVDKNKKDK